MEKTNSTPLGGRHLDPRSDPLLLRPAAAARFPAISPRKLWEMTNCREVPAIRIDRALRYLTEDLRAWVAACRTGRF